MAIVSCAWKIENACHSNYDLWITSWVICHCFIFLENMHFYSYLGTPHQWWATDPEAWSQPSDALLRGWWGGHHLWIHFCYWCWQWWLETDVCDFSRTSTWGGEERRSHSGSLLSGRCYLRVRDLQTHR